MKPASITTKPTCMTHKIQLLHTAGITDFTRWIVACARDCLSSTMPLACYLALQGTCIRQSAMQLIGLGQERPG